MVSFKNVFSCQSKNKILDKISKISDDAIHAWAILSLLVKRLRQVWPKVKITFRADSSFCKHQMLGWCEENNLHYIVGMAQKQPSFGAKRIFLK